MSSKLSLNLVAVDLPVIGSDHGLRVDLLRLAEYFQALAAGTVRGSTLEIRHAAVAASATATCAAVAGADTITLAGTALTAGQKHATGTVTLTSIAADATVTVNGVVFTAKASPSGVDQFDQSGSDTADAASLAAKINAHPSPLIAGVVTATSSLGVVTVRAVTAGAAGNAITLAASTESVSGATLSGGATFSTTVFDAVGSNAETATALALVINSNTTLNKLFTASASSDVVTISARVPGVVGNQLTLVSSNGTRLAVTGSGKLTSGSDGTLRTVTLG